jgi:hypothetical protein
MSRASVAPVLLYAGLLLAMVGGAPWPRPNWLVAMVGLAVIVVGIVAKRSAEAASLDAAASVSGASGAAADQAPLTDLAARVKALVEEVETAELGAIAARVSALQEGPVTTFSATQDDFVRRHGFQAWATVMAPLATGERLLFRAWSAASDGHRGETVASVKQALPFVEEAVRALAEIAAKRT